MNLDFTIEFVKEKRLETTKPFSGRDNQILEYRIRFKDLETMLTRFGLGHPYFCEPVDFMELNSRAISLFKQEKYPDASYIPLSFMVREINWSDCSVVIQQNDSPSQSLTY